MQKKPCVYSADVDDTDDLIHDEFTQSRQDTIAVEF